MLLVPQDEHGAVMYRARHFERLQADGSFVQAGSVLIEFGILVMQRLVWCCSVSSEDGRRVFPLMSTF